jgi:hypothetical protein
MKTTSTRLVCPTLILVTLGLIHCGGDDAADETGSGGSTHRDASTDANGGRGGSHGLDGGAGSGGTLGEASAGTGGADGSTPSDGSTLADGSAGGGALGADAGTGGTAGGGGTAGSGGTPGSGGTAGADAGTGGTMGTDGAAGDAGTCPGTHPPNDGACMYTPVQGLCDYGGDACFCIPDDHPSTDGGPTGQWRCFTPGNPDGGLPPDGGACPATPDIARTQDCSYRGQTCDYGNDGVCHCIPASSGTASWLCLNR